MLVFESFSNRTEALAPYKSKTSNSISTVKCRRQVTFSEIEFKQESLIIISHLHP